MKGFIFLLVLLVVGGVGLAFYREWLSVGSDNVDGKSNVTLSVDTDKLKADEKTTVANVQDVGRQIKDKVAGTNEKRMDGTVVSVSADKLMMTDKEGKEHSHALAANVKVTCDGKVCKAADLKSGMRIRVTTENADPHAATRIEALDNNRDFEKGA